MDTIPLLPNRIAASLQADVLAYMSELKFLFLFYERPLAIFSTYDLSFINDDVVDQCRKGKPVHTNFSEDSDGLANVEALGSDEWQQITDNCDCWAYSYDDSDTGKYESEDMDALDSLIQSAYPGQDVPTFEQLSAWIRSGDATLEVAVNWFGRISLCRLVRILHKCRQEEIALIWGDPLEVDVVRVFIRQLIDRIEHDDESHRSLRADFRTLKGDDLLREILNLKIVDLTTVPCEKIIEFRNRNSDLLGNFLTLYRNFLVDIQCEPSQLYPITQKYSQDIAKELNSLANELALLRAAHKFRWLRTCKQWAGGLSQSAVWSLLLSPLQLIIKSAEAASSASLSLAESLNERNSLIAKSSAGYLWKASTELKS
jgi:hypothetical protein